MSWGPFDLLRPLFDFLKCLVVFAVELVAAAVMGLVNLVLAGLMFLLTPLLALLPTVQLEDVSLPGFLAMANWLFPLDHLVVAMGITAVLLGVWHVASIGLRWLKVVE